MSFEREDHVRYQSNYISCKDLRMFQGGQGWDAIPKDRTAVSAKKC